MTFQNQGDLSPWFHVLPAKWVRLPEVRLCRWQTCICVRADSKRFSALLKEQKSKPVWANTGSKKAVRLKDIVRNMVKEDYT